MLCQSLHSFSQALRRATLQDWRPAQHSSSAGDLRPGPAMSGRFLPPDEHDWSSGGSAAQQSQLNGGKLCRWRLSCNLGGRQA